MDWSTVALKITASLAILFGTIATPIVLVSALSRGDLISVNQGIVVFASSLLVGITVLGLIWVPRARPRAS